MILGIIIGALIGLFLACLFAIGIVWLIDRFFT